MVKERPSHVFVHLDALSRRGQSEMRLLFARRGEIPGFRGSIGRILGLVRDGGSRQSELAEGAWITPQALGERIRQMEERGWVAVEVDPRDRRARIVTRTRAGERVLAEAESVIASMEEAWARQVGDDRYRTFREVLAELASTPRDDGDR